MSKPAKKEEVKEECLCLEKLTMELEDPTSETHKRFVKYCPPNKRGEACNIYKQLMAERPDDFRRAVKEKSMENLVKKGAKTALRLTGFDPVSDECACGMPGARPYIRKCVLAFCCKAHYDEQHPGCHLCAQL